MPLCLLFWSSSLVSVLMKQILPIRSTALLRSCADSEKPALLALLHPTLADRPRLGIWKTWLLWCLKNSRFGRIKLSAVEMFNSFALDNFGRLSAFLISWLLVCDQVQIPKREAANMCDYFLLYQVELKEWTYFTTNKCTLWTLD